MDPQPLMGQWSGGSVTEVTAMIMTPIHRNPWAVVPGGLRAGQASCCGAGGAGARGNACKWRRAVRVRLGLRQAPGRPSYVVDAAAVGARRPAVVGKRW